MPETMEIAVEKAAEEIAAAPETEENIVEALTNVGGSAIEAASWLSQNRTGLWHCGIGVLISLLIFFIIHISLKKLSGKDGEKTFLGKMARPIAIMFMLIGLSYSNSLIHFPGQWDQYIDKAFYALFIILALSVVFHVINYFDDLWNAHFAKKNPEGYAMSKLMLDLVRRILKSVVWFVTFLFIMQNVFNMAITPLLASAGVLGVAIAFAAQNTIANLFGACSILGSQLFKVGDWIKTAEAEGTVENIGLRSVRIRAFEGRLIDVPNRIIADAKLDNFSERSFCRENFIYGLVYQTTPDQIRRALAILEEICEEFKDIQVPGKKARFAFVECGDFALKISGYVWFNTTDWFLLQDYRQKINLAVMERFGQEGLSFAYPTQTLFVTKE